MLSVRGVVGLHLKKNFTSENKMILGPDDATFLLKLLSNYNKTFISCFEARIQVQNEIKCMGSRYRLIFVPGFKANRRINLKFSVF